MHIRIHTHAQPEPGQLAQSSELIEKFLVAGVDIIPVTWLEMARNVMVQPTIRLNM